MKSKILGTFTGKCCDAEVYNNNGMLLNRELFNNLINSEEYQRAMRNRYYIGFLGHPEDPNDMNFKNACIIMTSMEMHEDGSIWGTFDLVDTPVGRIVKAFIDAGVTFGISIRGAGDIDGTGKVDPETFVFRGYDLVTFPAYDDAVPEFREIAASTDIGTISKYKKVCATIRTNLPKINSCEALEVIQSQFDDSSREFQLIGDRMAEIENKPSDTINNVLQQKLDAMTNLYLAQVEQNRILFEENNQLRLSCARLTSDSDRQIRTIDRIMSSQITSMEKELSTIEAKYKTVVRANSKLKDQNQKHVLACNDLEARLQDSQSQIQELEKENSRLQRVFSSEKTKAARNLEQTTSKLHSVEAALTDKENELERIQNDNLIYQRKIESATQTIEDQKGTIGDLEIKLSETVAANQKLSSKSSNRDVELDSLRSEVIAAHQLVGEYQQAYADMCAGMIGISVKDIPITSTTSPRELKNYIFGSTSTSGIIANPSFAEPEQIERVDDEEFYGDGDLISL